MTSTTIDGTVDIFFAPVVVQAGAVLRVAARPDTANDITVSHSPTAAITGILPKNAFPVPQSVALSTRTDAGAWTDDLTSMPHIWLLLDQVGGPLLVHPGMSGGMRG
jgi:hypothetical protein